MLECTVKKQTLGNLFLVSLCIACGTDDQPKPSLSSDIDSLSGIQVHIEQIETPPDIAQMLDSLNLTDGSQVYSTSTDVESGSHPTMAVAPVFIENIVNTGKKFWTIVKEGKPSANIKADYATAIPSGLADANSLSNFSDLKYTTYSIVFQNIYKMDVVKGKYTIVHRYGGRYQGKGHYLANVGIVPIKWEVMTGFKTDYAVNKISAVNVGTAEDPIASLTMELRLDVRSFINTRHLTKVVQFRGDSPVPKLIQ